MEPSAFAALVRPDPRLPEPLTVQIYRAARDAIRSGVLPAGERLPSSRGAAGALGVSRNTLVAAYDLLRAEGVLATRAGAAPLVLPGAMQPICAAGDTAATPSLSVRGAALAEDARPSLYARSEGWLTPGSPDEALFPREIWARALRRAARRPWGRAANYADYSGLSTLREALAARLRADRGVVSRPQDVLVMPGAQAALALLAQAVGEPGDLALVESPGYAGARAAFSGAGLRLGALPVDEAGADVACAEGPARLVYVTPSNQYPLGLRMSLARRQALVERAQVWRALIVEDDYDSEFHWRGRQIGALQPLAPDLVAYVGSAAKSLSPGVRLGWIAAPEALAPALSQAQRNLGLGASLHAQAALAEMMESGAWRAHLRRISKAYAAREAALAEALERRLGDRVRCRRPDGGLQLAVELQDAEAEARAMAAAGRAGFGVAKLSAYGCGAPTRPGLLIGFADADERRIERFVSALERALSPPREAPRPAGARDLD